MFKPVFFNKCNLLQSCEWIAFGWKPTSGVYEFALERVRPSKYGTTSKPSMPYEKYISEINKAKIKLIIALSRKSIIATGTLGTKGHHHNNISILDNQTRYIIDYLDNFDIDYENNTIGNYQTDYKNIEIDFKHLEQEFPENTTSPNNTLFSANTFTLTLVNNNIILHTGNTQETLIKKLHPNAKNTQIISYIMNHPDKTITRNELTKLNITTATANNSPATIH